eukprot:scaffold1120_cov33-Attheya_sp.AAC.3
MDSRQACIKYVRQFNDFIAKRMTCEMDEQQWINWRPNYTSISIQNGQSIKIPQPFTGLF